MEISCRSAYQIGRYFCIYWSLIKSSKRHYKGLCGVYGVLPAFDQANRRDTKGFPGFSAKNVDVQGYGVNP